MDSKCPLNKYHGLWVYGAKFIRSVNNKSYNFEVMKHLTVVFFLLLSSAVFGQYDTAQVTKLLNKVYSKQVVVDKFYDSGLFRTQRIWKDRVMEDNTFFYTASLLYILQQIQPRLTAADQKLIDSLELKALHNIDKYANRKGEASYNFWQTNPDTPHPNGKEKHQQSKHGLPDDLDDSVILASVLANDSISSLLRMKILAYAKTNNHKPIAKAPKGYRETEAYRTWFADRWKQDVDIVVLSNVLLFVFENDFPLSEYDSATVNFIKKAVVQRDYLSQAKEISPYYGRPAVILYHLARLISSDKIGLFNSVKSQIVNDLCKTLETTHNVYEKMMVVTSLYRLGEQTNFLLDEAALLQDQEDFYFFYSTSANLSLAHYKLWLIKHLHLIPNMYWKCDAFNDVILLEFLVTTGYQLKGDFISNL